jgi:hypothetical protein
VPPKIHENSVFVYHSREKANAFRLIRAMESIGIAIPVLFFAQPIYSIPFLVIYYTLWGNALIYEASRRMVVRMDLLPHIEMVSF